MHMVFRYEYWFSNKIELEANIGKNLIKFPNGRCCLRLDPICKFFDLAEITHAFWGKVLKNPDEMPDEFRGTILSCISNEKVSASKLKKSSLFLVDTPVIVQEKELPLDKGCMICGAGKVLRNDPFIDEQTLTAAKIGITDQGRFIVHAQILQEMQKNGLTGFQVKNSVPSNYQDVYLAMLYKYASKQYVKEYPNQSFLDQLEIEEYGLDRLFIQIPLELYNTSDFEKFHSYLMALFSEEKIDYNLIPPAQNIEPYGKGKWFELEITGYAGSEKECNQYIQEALCPKCGQRGQIPENSFYLKQGGWDGSDVCLTDAGKICVSNKFAKTSLANDWFLGFSPINNS